MRALNGIMLAVLLVTGAGVTGADAEEARTGEVALIGATVLDHDVSGELAVDDADDLRELGGALLVSGETTQPDCGVRFQVGNVTRDVPFEQGLRVLHVPLDDVSSGGSWSMVPMDGCRVRLEGALLFVGEAAAYVGDDPAAWWRSARRTLNPGVR